MPVALSWDTDWRLVKKLGKGTQPQAKKRTFLGLLLAVLLLFTFLAVYLVLFARDPLAPFSRNVIMIITVAILIFAVLFLFGLFLAILSIMQNRTFPGVGWLTGKTLYFLYPLVVHSGRLFHIAQESIQHSFIAVNNRLVVNRPLHSAAKDILLLLPHCLQHDLCDYKITRDPQNCRRCGKCQVPEILDLTNEKGLGLEIVTGGTLARQAVEKHRPHAIIAVACERDLSSGILDSFPLPVYGVVNERPQGPCFNTRVNMTVLKETLDSILQKEKGVDE